MKTASGLNGILNLIYPPHCGICDKKLNTEIEAERAYVVCSECVSDMRRNMPPYCKRCGRSIKGSTSNVEVCWECFQKSCDYKKSYSCYLYGGAARELLHRLKYSKRLSLSGILNRLTIEFLYEHLEILEGIHAVVAVPLHKVKLREREFNQAHIITKAIRREFGIKDLSKTLIRTKFTQPQSKLEKKYRFENIKGTFGTTEPKLINGKNILLVDDLFTTGATLNECARTLKESGAQKIRCLTFARGA